MSGFAGYIFFELLPLQQQLFFGHGRTKIDRGKKGEYDFSWGEGKEKSVLRLCLFALQKWFFTPVSFCFAKETFYPYVLLLRKRDIGVK